MTNKNNKVMKANEAPEKLYFGESDKGILDIYSTKESDDEIEYTRTDAFVEKAKKWFEQQPETYDANGVRVYGVEDFEDFKDYLQNESEMPKKP